MRVSANSEEHQQGIGPGRINGHILGADTTAGVGMRRQSREHGNWGAAHPWVYTTVMCSWCKQRAYSFLQSLRKRHLACLFVFINEYHCTKNISSSTKPSFKKNSSARSENLTHCLSSGVNKHKQLGFLYCLM